MEEEPHAHENLVAKARRQDQNSRTGSVASLTESTNTQSVPEAVAERGGTAASTFLLEPMILVLLFAYNFSCKLWNGKAMKPGLIYIPLSATVLKSQIIYQSCTAGFGYSDAVCKQLGTKNATNETKRIEEQVQPYAASIFLTIKIVECIVPAFCGLFVGALADRYGRKPLLLASYLGYALQYMISALITYVAMHRGGMVSPWFFVLSIVPLSLLGSSVTYSVAAICYIGDVSTGKIRSYRWV